MQSRRLCGFFDGRRLRFGAMILVFVILCGGFIVVPVSTHDVAGDIVFPGPISLNSRSLDNNPTADDNDETIPLALARRLNSINTTEEFMQLLNFNERSGFVPSFTSKINRGEERSSASIAKPAVCIPELQPVSLKTTYDPSTIIFPSCTRIKRCGGCCSSSLLVCEPTATEMRNFEVIVASLNLNYRSREIVPLEEHTKCKCECKIKPKDCNDKQRYEPHNCMCGCKNNDEEEKCRIKNDIKEWNPRLCSCSCRHVEPCGTGFYFENNTCRCRQIMLSKTLNRFASTKGWNYNFGNTWQPATVSPVIISLDASDPRRKPKEDPEYK